jgi:hypothetical protein
VSDQQRALEYHTNVLGFVKHADIDLGGGQRWLTVIAAGRPQMELSLEPQTLERACVYQQALFEAGIPVTAFTTPPREAGPIITAVFEDTCGNRINLLRPLMRPNSNI